MIFFKKTKKIIVFLAIFITIFSWLFSGWPGVWKNPSIPPKIQKAQAITCGFGTDIGGGVCRGYLTTTGAGTWTVPNDWNSSSNSIETIGAGGGGCGHNAGGGNGGGGGGAYSKIINLTLSLAATIDVTIGAAGAFRGNGGDTWFNGTTCAGSSVCADGGIGSIAQAGGTGGTVANGKVTGAGSVQYKGGTGGDGNGTADSQGGGGGAGGPNGDGGAGGFGDNDNTTDGVGGGGGGNGGRTTTGGYVGGDGRVSDTVGANGGNNFNNDAGSGGTGGSPGGAGTNGGGGGGGSDAQAGGNGGAGIDWDATHGSGGGGGGSGDLQAGTTGGKGGLYGGGGGGGDNSGGQGVGAQGIIVITYTPVAASLTFVVSTNNFPTLTPSYPVFATTTLSVNTDNSTGWNVTLSGDDVAAGGGACDLDTDASFNITDLTPQWVNPAATTTAGNAVTITSGDDVLAFRVMTASGTVSFRASSWWGATDGYPGTSLWAGIASSTVSRKIGDSSVSCAGANCALNTVLYYLDVPTTQPTGAYTCPLTYTATMNP